MANPARRVRSPAAARGPLDQSYERQAWWASAGLHRTGRGGAVKGSIVWMPQPLMRYESVAWRSRPC